MYRMRVWISRSDGMMGSHLYETLAAARHDVFGTYYKDAADLAGLALEELDIRDWCSVYDSLMHCRPKPVFQARDAEPSDGVVATYNRDARN
jgi:nucleoside-diphosphate-sugar epimerase